MPKFNYSEFIKKNNLPNKGEKIVVAMSGGVDSSLAAVLLFKAGYEVIGVTMKLHSSKKNINKSKTCCSGVDIADAKSIAKKFGFKHFIIDYEDQFRNSVIDNFIESYLNGETPIPCIRCNQTVKFTDLIQFTQSIGSNVLVTGHYVRREFNKDEYSIYQAIDKTKDQSYFLFATTSNQLKFLRFPLGDFTKETVRKLATKFGLTNATKPDSQDICFIPDGNYKKFINKNVKNSIKKGNIENTEGKIIGQHNGIINYTVGQRRGIGIGGISGIKNKEPLYVIKIDKFKNTVIVGPKKNLAKYKIFLKNINLIKNLKSNEFNAQIKVRSGVKKVNAKIRLIGEDSGVVELSKPEFGVSPGQACVFYEKKKMIGGGWIVAGEKTNSISNTLMNL